MQLAVLYRRQAAYEAHPTYVDLGLGLTISKAIVERYGGEVGVKSVPGQGSTF